MDVQDRVRAILAAEAAAISSIPVDQSFESAIDTIIKCRGKIVASGMGKAGHTAQRFAAVLCATGTPAVFLHPGEAAHGDLGIVAEGDCIVVFSTSGKTHEVLEMVERSRALAPAKIIAITSHPDSKLRNLCEIVLNMGHIEEPCHLGLTPSASIAAMSAIADALALVLAEKKGLTSKDFSLRHHGGYLGRVHMAPNLDGR